MTAFYLPKIRISCVNRVRVQAKRRVKSLLLLFAIDFDANRFCFSLGIFIHLQYSVRENATTIVFEPAANKLNALQQNAVILAQPESIGPIIRKVPLGYGGRAPAPHVRESQELRHYERDPTAGPAGSGLFSSGAPFVICSCVGPSSPLRVARL
jgi:hypothetical protein